MNGTTSSRSTCHVFINVDCNQCLRLSGSPDQLILPVWRVPQDVELPDPQYVHGPELWSCSAWTNCSHCMVPSPSCEESDRFDASRLSMYTPTHLLNRSDGSCLA